jgi:RNA polymerase primary sigma factor
MNTYFNDIEKLQASENLVEANLKWAAKMAHKYKGNGLSLEDLIQEANYGLVVAASKYNPERGVKFLTYAQPWILKYIKMALGKNRSIVSQPGSFQRKTTIVNRAINKLEKENGSPATSSEIAALTGYSKTVVNSVLKNKINYSISLDKPVNDDDSRTVENVLDNEISYDTPSQIMESKEKYNELYEKLDALNERDKIAVTLRYIENLSLKEVGIHLGVTAAGASGIIKKAIKKMRA